MSLMWNISWDGKSLTQCHMDRAGSGPVIRLFLFSLQLLVQQSLLPARHFCGRADFLRLNWHHVQIPQVMCISDINLSCPRGSNHLNGKGVKKLPYQNFSRHVILKHRNEMKSHVWCRCLVYFPSCFCYLKCSLWHSYVIRFMLKSSL